MMRVASLALAVGLLTASPAFADPAMAPTWLAPAAAPSPARAEAPRVSWRTAAGAAFVVALGVGAYFIKRRRRAQLGGSDQPQLSVVEAVRVGPKGQIVLTNVRGRLLLLGVTDNAIQRIAWIGRVARAKAEAPAPPQPVSESDVPTIAPPPSRVGDKQPLRLAVPRERPFQAVLDALRTAGPAGSQSSDPLLEAAASTQDVVERGATRAVAMTTLRSLEPMLEGQVTGLKSKRPPKRKP